MTRVIDRLLFPPLCRHCGDPFEHGLSNVLCGTCFDAIIPDQDPRCLTCGRPLPEGAFEAAVTIRCRDCRDRSSPLDGVRAYGAYDGALRLAHHFFKFESMPSLAGVLGWRMAEAAGNAGDESLVLVPVPLSDDRERERGYNPAGLLAAEIAGRTGWPLKDLLVKARSTKPQMKLEREERLKNPRGAYAIRKGNGVPASILLVDDVYTTGATLEECARVLKNSGASEVKAVVLGRTTRLLPGQ